MDDIYDKEQLIMEIKNQYNIFLKNIPNNYTMFQQKVKIIL